MNEEQQYIEFNDTLRTKLAEKIQQNLLLSNKLEKQDKLIRAYHEMFTAQVDLQIALNKAIKMHDDYERTK